MTSYINNRRIQMISEFLKPYDWLKGDIIKRAGRFALTENIPRKGGTVQLNDLYATGAKVKVSDAGEFPEGGNVKDISIVRSPKWFNGIVEYDHRDFEDLEGKDNYFLQDYKKKVDNVFFAHDQEVEDWFVGYSATWASDPHVDNTWIPWFDAVAAASSSASNPADINHLVTNIAGTTGTEGTLLDMTTILTSTTTNMTVDFARHTFRPIMRAFEVFKDANTGLRMVGPSAHYTFMAAQTIVRELESVRPYDNEKIDMSISIAEQMRNMGIDLAVCEDFTSSLEEDGVCQFGFAADFERNFQLAPIQKMSAGAWKDTGGVLPKHQQPFESRYMPYTQPYWDGSAYWRKPFFHGSFIYKNDAA